MNLKGMLLAGLLSAMGQGYYKGIGLAQMSAQAAACGYGYTPVSHRTAKRIMETQRDLKVLDARTVQEYRKGHLPGAVLLPGGGTTLREVVALLPDKGQMLLVYCHSGNRSRQAAARLASFGYSNVYDMGGVQSWPYEMVYPS